MKLCACNGRECDCGREATCPAVHEVSRGDKKIKRRKHKVRKTWQNVGK